MKNVTLSVSSGEQFGHEQVDTTLKSLKTNKEILNTDLQKLEKSIDSKYKEAASIIQVQKADLNRNSQKLTTAIEKHGEDLNMEIDNMMIKLKPRLDK